MDSRFKHSKHESVASNSVSYHQTHVANKNPMSAATHPSIVSTTRTRHDLDMIFKKITGGDDILSRLPSFIDPTVQFSDDEDENEAPVKCDKHSVREVDRTPQLLTPKVSSFIERQSSNKHYSTNEKKNVSSVDNIAKSLFNSQRSKGHAVSDNLQRKIADSVKSKLDFGPKKSNTHDKLMTPNSHPKNNLANLCQQNTLIPQLQSNIISKNSSEVIRVNNKSYTVLSLLGSGGSCKVYSVFDPDKNLVAIKRVNFANTDAAIKEGYKKEIEYLTKLQGSDRVIKMYDYEYRKDELLLVLERGDIDFAKYISNQAKCQRLSPLMIKFYWSQMLQAVAVIHKYGIVHSDLKPANFLLVAGNLKLIDFGIATSVPEDMTSTFRDTQMGTLNYMSPEAITQASQADSKQSLFKVGVKSDVWSLGCILYNLVYGTTPFFKLNSLAQKIHAITNQNYEIPFPSLPDELLLDVLKSCLKRNVKERASVEDLLKHPYLTENKNSIKNISPREGKLTDVLTQMQNFTPRRMSYLTQIVKELSDNTKK